VTLQRHAQRSPWGRKQQRIRPPANTAVLSPNLLWAGTRHAHESKNKVVPASDMLGIACNWRRTFADEALCARLTASNEQLQMLTEQFTLSLVATQRPLSLRAGLSRHIDMHGAHSTRAAMPQACYAPEVSGGCFV